MKVTVPHILFPATHYSPQLIAEEVLLINNPWDCSRVRKILSLFAAVSGISLIAITFHQGQRQKVDRSPGSNHLRIYQYLPFNSPEILENG